MGRSPHQRELCAVLDALEPGSARPVHDLYEDLGAATTSATTSATASTSAMGVELAAPLLLLDSDHVAVEDIGWIRRMLSIGRLSAVVVMGTDPAEAVVRRLRQSPAVSWTPWPPDLEELRRLAQRARPSSAAAVSRSPAGPSSADEVPQRISDHRGSTSEHNPSPLTAAAAPPRAAEPPAPLVDVPEVAPPLESSPVESPSLAAPTDILRPFAAATAPLPQAVSLTVGRDQVAVLADISQRLELAFLALRESGRVTDPDLEGPQIELRRLMRFTRSLACLAAPPPRGADEFDIAAVIEELLATLTLRGRRGPRFQPGAGSGGRPSVEFLVRADRAALTMAFETVLAVARLCSSSGDTVRVAYTPVEPNAVSIQVEFPAGPLVGVDPHQLLDVGVLRERLPELGPNELAAAGAIVRSQGGEMDFATPSEGQIAVLVRLPIERRASAGKRAARVEPAARSAPTSSPTRSATGPRAEAAPQARSDDPFA